MALNPNESEGTWLYKLKEQDNPGSEHFGFAAQLPEQNVRREVHIGYHSDPSIIILAFASAIKTSQIAGTMIIGAYLC
jgi:hypothetical protein